MDIDSVLLWHKFNYIFDEASHSYYWQGKTVRNSVTQFIERYCEPFDSENISKRYAQKHNLSQKEVLDDWDRNGRIASQSGTIIHKYLEENNKNRIVNIDYTCVDDDIKENVKERIEILLPKAKAFLDDTRNRLIPIELEYTVGYEDFIAGNIDMVCWNVMKKEIQIWDYKNSKSIEVSNKYNKYMLSPFQSDYDCNYIHYSLQLSMYKALLEMGLSITIGNCYIVQFDPQTKDNVFNVFEVKDFSDICKEEILWAAEK